MADLVTGFNTSSGETRQYDYNALGNKPNLNNLATKDEVNSAIENLSNVNWETIYVSPIFDTANPPSDWLVDGSVEDEWVEIGIPTDVDIDIESVKGYRIVLQGYTNKQDFSSDGFDVYLTKFKKTLEFGPEMWIQGVSESTIGGITALYELYKDTENLRTEVIKLHSTSTDKYTDSFWVSQLQRRRESLINNESGYIYLTLDTNKTRPSSVEGSVDLVYNGIKTSKYTRSGVPATKFGLFLETSYAFSCFIVVQVIR